MYVLAALLSEYAFNLKRTCQLIKLYAPLSVRRDVALINQHLPHIQGAQGVHHRVHMKKKQRALQSLELHNESIDFETIK